MGLSSKLESLLFFLELYGICSGFLQENCTNYKLQFERVFSVPGDVAMLNSTLVSPDVFNFTSVPYNITWYESKTGRELSNQPGQILVQRETLWLLNVTLDDDGEYITIVRTPTRCYRQTTRLEVNQPDAGECVRPKKSGQMLMEGVDDNLFCPLKDYIKKLDSYNITSSIKWYKDCNLIVDGKDNITYWGKTKLMIKGVMPHHKGSYTCILTFTLGGVTGSVSETIDAWVKEEYCLVPEVREPANEIIKAEMGSSFKRRCLVFVPGGEWLMIDIFWLVRNKIVFSTNSSDHFYTSETRMWSQDSPRKGVWLERMLMFSKLTEKDFNINYTCHAYSHLGNPVGYFTLLPAEPDLILPMGLVFGGVTVLFIISVIVYYLFKVDIVLWFR